MYLEWIWTSGDKEIFGHVEHVVVDANDDDANDDAIRARVASRRGVAWRGVA